MLKYMWFYKYFVNNGLTDSEKYFTEDIKKKFGISEKSDINQCTTFDDSAIAINTNLNLEKCGMIFLVPGNYAIPNNILANDRLILIGLGENVNIKLDRKIIFTGKFLKSYNINFHLVENIDYHSKENLCTAGIIIPSKCEACVKFTNCKFYGNNVVDNMLYFGPLADNPSIVHCTFDNTSVKFSGYPSNVRHCNIKYNKFISSGINLHTYSGNIYNNDFTGNSKLDLFRSRVKILSNTFKNIDFDLVSIDYSSDVHFMANYVMTNPSAEPGYGSVFNADRSSRCTIEMNTFILKKNQTFFYSQWESQYSLFKNIFNNPDIVIYHEGIKMKHLWNYYVSGNSLEDTSSSISDIVDPNKTYLAFGKIGFMCRKILSRKITIQTNKFSECCNSNIQYTISEKMGDIVDVQTDDNNNSQTIGNNNGRTSSGTIGNNSNDNNNQICDDTSGDRSDDNNDQICDDTSGGKSDDIQVEGSSDVHKIGYICGANIMGCAFGGNIMDHTICDNKNSNMVPINIISKPIK